MSSALTAGPRAGTTLAALSLTSCVALAGPFDLVNYHATDTVVGDPVSAVRTTPVVENASFRCSFERSGVDPLGAASAIPGYATPLRAGSARRSALPLGFDREYAPLGPLDLGPGQGPALGGDESLGLTPTPGALALVGAGGLGFVRRRGV